MLVSPIHRPLGKDIHTSHPNQLDGDFAVFATFRITNMDPDHDPWKIVFLYKLVVFRFHVSLQGYIIISWLFGHVWTPCRNRRPIQPCRVRRWALATWTVVDGRRCRRSAEPAVRIGGRLSADRVLTELEKKD